MARNDRKRRHGIPELDWTPLRGEELKQRGRRRILGDANEGDDDERRDGGLAQIRPMSLASATTWPRRPKRTCAGNLAQAPRRTPSSTAITGRYTTLQAPRRTPHGARPVPHPAAVGRPAWPRLSRTPDPLPAAPRRRAPSRDREAPPPCAVPAPRQQVSGLSGSCNA